MNLYVNIIIYTTQHDLTLDEQETVYWSIPSVYIQTGVVDSTSARFLEALHYKSQEAIL